MAVSHEIPDLAYHDGATKKYLATFLYWLIHVEQEPIESVLTNNAYAQKTSDAELKVLNNNLTVYPISDAQIKEIRTYHDAVYTQAHQAQTAIILNHFSIPLPPIQYYLTENHNSH